MDRIGTEKRCSRQLAKGRPRGFTASDFGARFLAPHVTGPKPLAEKLEPGPRSVPASRVFCPCSRRASFCEPYHGLADGRYSLVNPLKFVFPQIVSNVS